MSLKLSSDLDLTKVFVRAVRELSEAEGSSIRAVEKFIRASYEIDEQVTKKQLKKAFLLFLLRHIPCVQEVDLSELLRLAAKKAVVRGLVTHHEDNNFKAVIGE